jgi:hypothetical protein
MLNFIAGDLRYFGLNRVVDVRSGQVTWSTLMELDRRMIFHASGNSPDGALENVLNKALAGKSVPTLDTTLSLDQIADNLLQLVIRYSQAEADADKPWSALGRFQQKRTFWLLGGLNRPGTIQVMGASPDEVLNELIRRAKK